MSPTSQPQTVRQTAAALNVSEAMVRTLIARRRVSFVRIGRCVRVPSAEIQRILDCGLVPAEQQEAR